MEKIKHAFKTHPDEDVLYMTSDEQKFFKENDANSHAADLKDKKVKPFYRSEVNSDDENKPVLVEVVSDPVITKEDEPLEEETSKESEIPLEEPTEEKELDEMPDGEPDDGWTNEHLRIYCEQVGIEVKKSATKKELLTAIKEAE